MNAPQRPLDPAPWTRQKIAARHHERLAVVYVRQSTTQQLIRHQESTRLQYGLTERAYALGWSRERIVVIDDDLGHSGTSAEGRPGFQRLVAEVGLDHVGIVLGIEMSRLARSCRDWHHLLEVCALFGTLLGDLDGIYDPGQYNDRLLLGLKGTMSEAEVHVLKQRMLEGKRAKARRGELGMQVPIGYVRRPSGEVVQEPDEQAREVVATVFRQFEVRGTLNGVLRYLVEHGIPLPVRVRSGLCKGDLQWQRPNRQTLRNVLRNPIYAGAYVYGRRPTDPRRKRPGRPATGRTVAGVGQWDVLLRDRVPAYISWETYEANQKHLESNCMKALGVPRRGPTLLSRLLVCGRCNRRMVTQYSSGYGRYSCVTESATYGGELCQSLAARVLDAEVERLVLAALEPAALDVSLAVAANLEAERARTARGWSQRLERAQYEVDRARRQYDAVEPENRLVARTLERDLEARLTAHKALEEEHRRYLAAQPTVLTAAERDAIRALAADVPTLWRATSTTTLDRQAIVRQLIEHIRVTVVDDSERVAVTIAWHGGHRTETGVVRPVARVEQLSYHDALVAHVRALRAAGKTYVEIAQQLNAEGRWPPPKRRTTYTPEMIRTMMSRLGLTARGSARRPRRRLGKDEWTLSTLAAELAMPVITLHSWVRKGWVQARKVTGNPGYWVIRADADERARLRARKTTRRTKWPRPVSTTSPSRTPSASRTR